MKKHLLIFLFLGLFFGTMQAQNEGATIDFEEIDYWVGEGSNQAAFICTFCDYDVALAWGYRFNGEIMVAEMLTELDATDPRLTIDGVSSFVNSISFVDDTYNVTESMLMYTVDGVVAAGIDGQNLVNGNKVYFGGYLCGNASDDWSTMTWNIEIVPVSDPDGGNEVVDTSVFDGVVGSDGCQAIYCQDPAILGWASQCTIARGWQDITQPTVVASFGSEADAIGAATESTMEVVSLGDSGVAILTFDMPIQNGDGYDFAVFENALNDHFLELAFVEVSSDGINYARFPAVSNTQTITQIGNADSVDATRIYNLAGKYRVGWGTPFNLDEIADNELIDVNNITHIKIIDVIGTIDPARASRDKNGHIINDPYPTNFASSGFDLAGVCVLNGWLPGQSTAIIEQENPTLSVFPNPCSSQISMQTTDNEMVAIYDLTGKRMFQTIGNGNTITIDVAAYPSGIYLVQCGVRTARLVKM